MPEYLRSTMDEPATYKRPSVKYSAAVVCVIVAIIAAGVIGLSAPIQLLMLIALLVVVPLAMRLRYTYKDVEKLAFSLVNSGLQPVMILLAVGALIGAWILAGTVPTIVYAGTSILSPQYFLVTTVLFCSIISLAIGTSWGTVGTVGLALMLIGEGLGMPPGLSAGAIVCGAFFGDKMSPLSDTTNLAPAVSGTTLIPHIKHMTWTTVPAYVVTLVIFFFVGLGQDRSAADLADVELLKGTIASTYNIGFIPLIPALLVLVLLVLRKPAFTSILTGALAGAVVALVYQGEALSAILRGLYDGTDVTTGVAFVDDMLSAGGMTSFLELIALIILALMVAGILRGTGILDTLIMALAGRVKTSRGVTLSTIIITYINVALTGSSSYTLPITATLMQPLYKRHRIKGVNLSRILEDCGTLGAPFVPWGVTALVISAALGVDPLVYIPFYFFGFLTPLVTLFYSLTGITITKVDGREENREAASPASSDA